MDAEQIQGSESPEGMDEGNRNRPVAERNVVDRIRDILVGSQMREVDTRLQHLDEYVVSASNETHAEVQKRIEASENFLRGQLDTLTNRLDSEQSERRSAIENLAGDIAEANKAFDVAHAGVQKRIEATENFLRGQLETLKNRLDAEQSERHSAIEKLAGDLAEANKAFDVAHADVQKRIEASENFLRGQLETLTNRLDAEQSERRSAIEKLAGDLAEANKAFELKIQNLAEYACDIHELHRQLVEQSQTLTTEVKQRHEQMLASLDHHGEQIRGAMISREALAEILGDVALRVKNESRRPDV